jgi:hypothetical protein
VELRRYLIPASSFVVGFSRFISCLFQDLFFRFICIKFLSSLLSVVVLGFCIFFFVDFHGRGKGYFLFWIPSFLCGWMGLLCFDWTFFCLKLTDIWVGLLFLFVLYWIDLFFLLFIA